MTSWPCSASSAAATDESTPPDIATTIRTFLLTPSTVYHEGTKHTRRTRCGVDPFWWTGALHHSCRFEGGRRLIAERRVQPLRVVKAIDVLADRVGGRRFIGPVGRIELLFQRAEEAFDNGIIPAIPTTTHARHEAMRGEHALILPAGVLDAAIR